MTTELAVSNATLERFGTPEERSYLAEVMASMLGIPARDAQKPEVVAIVARAVEWKRTYGWDPGIHFHVQKYETGESKGRRKNDPDALPVYDYQLTDGEKGWKDSATRWRLEYGVNWKFQRKKMTREELEDYCVSIGMKKQDISPHAVGIWCRCLDMDIDDPRDPDNPMWAAGVWSGKVKVGKWWNDDRLPTGTDPQRVAVRRCDKAAIMQSEMSLLPLDSKTPEQREAELRAQVQTEIKHLKVDRQVPDSRPVVVEEDGNVLFAHVDGSTQTKGSTQENVAEGDFTHVEGSTQPKIVPPENPTVEEDIDFGAEGSTQPEEADFSPFASIMHNPDYKIPEAAMGLIQLFTGLHKDSQRNMSAKGYDALTDMMNEKGVLEAGINTSDDVVHIWEALTQSSGWNTPGMKCGKAMQAVLGSPEQTEALNAVRDLVVMVTTEMDDIPL